MLELIVFIKGIIIGLLVAIPIGPVGLLCVKRTLDKGKLSGFVSGLGAVVANVFYGSIAAFGVVSVLDFLFSYQVPIRLVGVVFLLYVGIKTFYQAERKSDYAENGTSYFADFASTLLLAITNPTLIVSFTAIFAGAVSDLSSGRYDIAFILVLGLSLGSMLWWTSLCLLIGRIKSKMRDFSMVMVNKFVGIATIFIAVLVLVSVINIVWELHLF